MDDTVLGIVTGVENAAHDSGIANTLHGTTDTVEMLGLGHIGEANLVTDVLNTPEGLLSGDTTPLTDIPADVTHVVAVAEKIPQGLVTELQGGILNSASDPLGAMSSLTHIPSDIVISLQPLVNDLVGSLLPHTNTGLTGLETALGLTSDADGHNLIQDVALTPEALLHGDPSAILDHLPDDLADTVHGVQGLVDGVVADVGHGGIGGSNPLGGILNGSGDPLGGILHGNGDPLGGILHGGEGNGGLLDGVLNGTGLLGPGNGEGSHNLVTAAVGPEAANGGLLVNLLTPTGDSSHAVDVNAVQAPQSTPTIANLSVLTDTLHLPSGGGGLADALSGVLDIGSQSHAAAPTAPAPAPDAMAFHHIDVPLAPAVSEVMQSHHALA